MRVFPRPLAAALAGTIGLLAVGCEEGDPASVRLNVVFPSTALAIASEEVRFIVYDDPEPGACQRIYLKRITNQTNLPPVVLESRLVPMCDLALGRGSPLELPLGKYSILAVALRGKEDLLVGCSDVALSSEGGDVFVNLALPGATPVPPLSNCLSLTEACTNPDACR
ncbi:MAG: hypothetical protein KF819_11450 [Labilithrix sp.]|nr:hypothetical protein [Labilithrix sp.]